MRTHFKLDDELKIDRLLHNFVLKLINTEDFLTELSDKSEHFFQQFRRDFDYIYFLHTQLFPHFDENDEKQSFILLQKILNQLPVKEYPLELYCLIPFVASIFCSMYFRYQGLTGTAASRSVYDCSETSLRCKEIKTQIEQYCYNKINKNFNSDALSQSCLNVFHEYFFRDKYATFIEGDLLFQPMTEALKIHFLTAYYDNDFLFNIIQEEKRMFPNERLLTFTWYRDMLSRSIKAFDKTPNYTNDVIDSILSYLESGDTKRFKNG